MSGYFATYRVDTGELVSLDEQDPDYEQGEVFRTLWFRGDMPPLSKYYWDKSQLAFLPRGDVAITQLAFRNRFLPAEKTAIYTAAESNVEVRIWLDDLAATTSVRLNNAQTIASVQALEAAGLIGPGRADEILNTPAAAHELAE